MRELKQSLNYAAGKTKIVAWFVSNCEARNNRAEYAKELGQHIQVDIYGKCGNLSCGNVNNREICYNGMLKNDYKFYLAFENANCNYYITEKFFNTLGNAVPIVMGASINNYERIAPKGSFIHVDSFRNPKELADYLKMLNAHDDLYNKYYEWIGTGEKLSGDKGGYDWCRVCAMLHGPYQHKTYRNTSELCNPTNVCQRFAAARRTTKILETSTMTSITTTTLSTHG